MLWSRVPPQTMEGQKALSGGKVSNMLASAINRCRKRQNPEDKPEVVEA